MCKVRSHANSGSAVGTHYFSFVRVLGLNDCASSTTGNKSQCSLKHLEDEASLLSGNEIDTRLRGIVRQIKFT